MAMDFFYANLYLLVKIISATTFYNVSYLKKKMKSPGESFNH